MKRCFLCFSPMALSLLAFGQSPYSSLQVPKQIQYQGRVLQNGQPFDGNGHFVFGVYEGSTLLWTNKLPVPSPLNDPGASIDSSDSKSLTVRNGVFTVRLGEGDTNNAPVGTDVFFKFDGTQRVRTDVKLAVWFSPAAEGPYTRLVPNITFASVPFAQVAGVAETVKERAVTGGMLADSSVDSAKLVNDSVSREDLQDMVRSALVPPGTILPYGGTVAPTGYLMCAGGTYEKATYLALSSVLNNAFGGDATTFRVPDLRGRFLRGTDDPDGALANVYTPMGRDPDTSAASRPAMNSGGNSGNAVGSLQSDEFRSHTHVMNDVIWDAGGAYGRLVGAGNVYGFGWSALAGMQKVTSAIGGSETRPNNANVNYIIKY